MHKVVIFLLLPLLIACRRHVSEKQLVINPLIGDQSFEATYGRLPDETTGEDLRITTHLSYVERMLRQKRVDHLSPEARARRERMLDLLHDYWVRGIYPRNYEVKDRRAPCFIDRDGKICAVGYLIEQTAGREVAEEINKDYQYAWIREMNDERVLAWVAQSGLTLDECATIQPAYSVVPPSIVPSIAASGANGALTTLNVIQLRKGSNQKLVPVLGIVSGLGQIAIGLNQTSPHSGWEQDQGRRIREGMSATNIGMGLSTVILSTWNLLHKKEPAERQTQLTVYSAPAYNQHMTVGLHLKHKL